MVTEQTNTLGQQSDAASNNLFPVFLKLEKLRLLIVGGGHVGIEKLNAVLANSPATQIKLVATHISDDIKAIAAHTPSILLLEKPYEASDLDNIDIVIAGIDDMSVSQQVVQDANDRGILVNAADKPGLCDFYLGSVVKKGNLKIAISTNGKSPTLAKRLKETFSEMLPEELDEVLDNMETIRKKLNGNFAAKVNKLNKITKVLIEKGEIEPDNKNGEKRWKKIATWCLFAFFFMFVGHFILSYVPVNDILASIKTLPNHFDNTFYWMIFAGFLAQLVDGALGMGYGVTCTTILLSLGVNLPAISGSIHTAEMFSSGVSGYSHYKFGNVNKKLFKVLIIPGIIGAVVGAFLLSKYGTENAKYIRPVLAAYTLFLGARIFYTAFKKNKKPQKVKNAGWLAGAGGFLDSFGGGGWGPLVTSTLISKGRTPRFVIGTVSITEFFVTLASALTFFGMLGISHWQIIVGLVIGGMVAAPFAAKLAGRLPLKTMFISVGSLVIIWSLRILLQAIGVL
ncbi:MAG: TSUP family transporter [Bacteroidota bacterium]